MGVLELFRKLSRGGGGGPEGGCRPVASDRKKSCLGMASPAEDGGGVSGNSGMEDRKTK